ncbi:MAG: hypothetical protein GX285_05135 [Clostridiales bacterium]|nr:hypothetical protein [Clostridiales bacterium]
MLLLVLSIFILNGKADVFLISLFSVFLHESSHYGMAGIFGYKIERMELNIWGGVLDLENYVIKPFHEILILIIGPFTNLSIAFIFSIISGYINESFINNIIFVNTVLVVFNLIPIAPLDGGKIVRLYLTYFIGYGKAIKVTLAFSKIFAFFLFLAGIYLVQYDILNITICFAAVNIYIASKKESSFTLYRVMRYMDIADQQKLTSRFVVYKSNEKIKDAIDTFNPSKKRVFTIVNGKGKYKGQLSEADIIKGIIEEGIYCDFERILESKKFK